MSAPASTAEAVAEAPGPFPARRLKPARLRGIQTRIFRFCFPWQSGRGGESLAVNRPSAISKALSATKFRAGRMSTDADTVAQTHPFQAEVADLLRLMVNAVYSEADVFLRELISNASDACDRLRYEAIAQPELLAAGGALAIRIAPDAKAGTLTGGDTGIGMDRQELIDNLGTVARSGTRAFMSRLAEAKKEDTKDGTKDGSALIGQFGVGFYSAFMVADRIEVTSTRAGSPEAWVWVSDGGAGFDIRPASPEEAARVPRGTEVVLHLKPDSKRYLEPHEIERI